MNCLIEISNSLRIILAVIIVVVLVLIFIGSYVLNKKTKAPEGCKKLDCEGCKLVECHNHPSKNLEKDADDKDNQKGDE